MVAFRPEALAASEESRWTLPDITTDDADQPERPNIFDTIALQVRARPTSTRWTKIVSASLNQPALFRSIEHARDLPPKEQVEYVQAMVSHVIRNRPPSTNCSDDGYWASASETLSRGTGDCIDIAVAKMEALRLLGIPESHLYLTTGYVGTGAAPGKGRESAALLVKIDEYFWLLPEQSDWVIDANGTTDGPAEFAPMITYGLGNSWVHGKLVKTAMMGN